MHLKFLSTNSKTTVLFLGIPCRGILLLILQSINLLELPNKLLQNEWLTQQKCVVSCFWRLEARDKVSKGGFLLNLGRRLCFLLLSQLLVVFCQYLTLIDLSCLCLHFHMAFSWCASKVSPFIRTSVISD